MELGGPTSSRASAGVSRRAVPEGTGIELYRDGLFAEVDDRIVRYARPSGTVVPGGKPETVLSGLPLTGDHPMHPFAIDARGSLYVNLGSATNACQVENRTPGSLGYQPCTELLTRAGIWRYEAERRGQRFSPNERFVTGLRTAGGIAVDPTGVGIYATQHGRDQLAENWPHLYRPEQGANLPAEELVRLERGADYGWPECYYDATQRKLVLALEYGGDGGKAVGICGGKKAPVAAFPAHWAPNDLLIYDGQQFPAPYRAGAFIAFHGSWNRAPFPQGGYNVVFQPLANGKPSGPYVVFADGRRQGARRGGPSAGGARDGARRRALRVGRRGRAHLAHHVPGRDSRVAGRARGRPPRGQCGCSRQAGGTTRGHPSRRRERQPKSSDARGSHPRDGGAGRSRLPSQHVRRVPRLGRQGHAARAEPHHRALALG